MSGDIEKEPGENLRHELLDAIAESISEADSTAAVALAKATNLLRPFEIVEYLDVKDKHCEGSEQQETWRDVLGRYLGDLAGREFPPEEEVIITNAARRLEFETILEEGGLATTEKETDIAAIENEVDAYGWDNDEFHVRLDPETIERVQATAIWQTVEKFMGVGYGKGSELDYGHWIIMKNLHGSRREEALAVFDGRVFEYVHRIVADKYRHLNRYTRCSGGVIKKTIDEFTSSRAVALEMQRACDKYIFHTSERALKETRYNRAEDKTPREIAVGIIRTGASSTARRDAMMDRLDLSQKLLP